MQQESQGTPTESILISRSGYLKSTKKSETKGKQKEKARLGKGERKYIIYRLLKEKGESKDVISRLQNGV
jgi:hypothetical protein